jgi:predicted nucleic acid-binding protein
MANAIIDTSAWIEAFRGRDPRLREAVDSLLDQGRVVLCGLVELELLQGFRADERTLFASLFEALPYAEVDRQDWRAAGFLLAGLRARGITIPATDALIAALCLRHDLLLLTLDKHFDQIPQLRRFKLA